MKVTKNTQFTLRPQRKCSLLAFKKPCITANPNKLAFNRIDYNLIPYPIEFSRNKILDMSTNHGLRTPREQIAFPARPKIHSHSQIFRYGGSIFCLPHRPNFSDIFDLCRHWVSVVRVMMH